MGPAEYHAPEDDELDLRVYLDLLRRRWKVIAITLGVVIALAMALTFQATPMYRATSEILIEQNRTSVTSEDDINVQAAARGLNNEERVFESPKVRAAVEEVYDGPLDISRVKATTRSDDSDILSTTVSAADPKDAEELLNVYVETFIEVRRADRLQQLLAISNEIESQIDELNSRIAEIRAPLDAVEAQLAADPTNEALLSERADLQEDLSGQLDPLLRQRANFEAQVEELGVAQDIMALGNVTVLGEAEASNAPVSPQPSRNLAVAVVIGLILGVGLAFARDSLDDRIRSTADLDELTGGQPTLAVIPLHDGHKAPNFVATRDDRQSVQAESYRSLRTAIRFAGIDQKIKVIQLTSPNQGEGKSTTAANLAVTFAQAGEKVLIICCDLRRPRIQERFNAVLEPGFTDVLVNDSQPVDVMRRTIDPALSVLTAGSPPPNPSELLSTDRAEAVIRAAAERFDVVIIDSPPVNPVTDAVIVSRLVDAVVVVADSRSTKRDRLRSAMRILEHAKAPVLGVVLNGVSQGLAGGGYGYGYGYAEAPAKPERRRRRVEPPKESATARNDVGGETADAVDQQDETVDAVDEKATAADDTGASEPDISASMKTFLQS